jgi:hypothetical protein
MSKATTEDSVSPEDLNKSSKGSQQDASDILTSALEWEEKQAETNGGFELDDASEDDHQDGENEDSLEEQVESNSVDLDEAVGEVTEDQGDPDEVDQDLFEGDINPEFLFAAPAAFTDIERASIPLIDYPLIPTQDELMKNIEDPLRYQFHDADIDPDAESLMVQYEGILNADTLRNRSQFIRLIDEDFDPAIQSLREMVEQDDDVQFFMSASSDYQRVNHQVNEQLHGIYENYDGDLNEYLREKASSYIEMLADDERYWREENSIDTLVDQVNDYLSEMAPLVDSCRRKVEHARSAAQKKIVFAAARLEADSGIDIEPLISAISFAALKASFGEVIHTHVDHRLSADYLLDAQAPVDETPVDDFDDEDEIYDPLSDALDDASIDEHFLEDDSDYELDSDSDDNSDQDDEALTDEASHSASDEGSPLSDAVVTEEGDFSQVLDSSHLDELRAEMFLGADDDEEYSFDDFGDKDESPSRSQWIKENIPLIVFVVAILLVISVVGYFLLTDTSSPDAPASTISAPSEETQTKIDEIKESFEIGDRLDINVGAAVISVTIKEFTESGAIAEDADGGTYNLRWESLYNYLEKNRDPEDAESDEKSQEDQTPEDTSDENSETSLGPVPTDAEIADFGGRGAGSAE